MPSRTRTHTRTPPLWDPQTVLKVDNMGRCAGWAHSRGRNCAMTIAYHNQQNAECLMKEMSAKEPDSIALEDDLDRLAGFVLCRRFHQDQADDMVEKWIVRMDRFAATRVRSSRSRSSRTSSEASTRTSEVASPSTSPSQSEIQLQSLVSQHVDLIAQLQATIAALTAQIPSEDMPAIPVAGSTLFPSPTSVSALPRSDSRPRPAEPTPPQAPRSSSSTTAAPVAQRPVSAPAPCTATHVRRRAVDENCPICCEPFLADERLAWCKSECGRTVHKACFADWEKTCRDNGREVTCGICRAAWGRECGC